MVRELKNKWKVSDNALGWVMEWKQGPPTQPPNWVIFRLTQLIRLLVPLFQVKIQGWQGERGGHKEVWARLGEERFQCGGGGSIRYLPVPALSHRWGDGPREGQRHIHGDTGGRRKLLALATLSQDPDTSPNLPLCLRDVGAGTHLWKEPPQWCWWSPSGQCEFVSISFQSLELSSVVSSLIPGSPRY